MNNEYPPPPTQMCEPVYMGTSNIGKRVSTKKYKQSLHVFFGYYRFGRIKRMRKGESICNGILRRIHGTSIVIPRNHPDMYEKMLTKLTRWTRH